MDAIERAVPAPQIEIIVQGRAWRQVFRNRAPLAARAQDVHQTVSNLAQVHRALITTRLGRREAWLDQRPLRIGPVAWIAQVGASIAGTIFGRPHRQRLPQNQAATLESQPIHPIQYLPGQTLSNYALRVNGVDQLRRGFPSKGICAPKPPRKLVYREFRSIALQGVRAL